MSNEPSTNGKVILKTTLGDLEIELWTKEAPMTSRNFVQLCMEGYYDGCIFHRVIPQFIAQTGDPTGTGTGGASIYDGQPFKDEFHSRLRFNRRGLVGMASTGKEPNSNQSQFFITLDSAEQLTRKHTVFGRVVGDSLFNILKANELEIDDNDLPLFPPKILGADVIWNPFDDIILRKIDKPKVDSKSSSIQKKKVVAAAVKNKGLLSFGEEDEDGDNITSTIKQIPKKKEIKKIEEKKEIQKIQIKETKEIKEKKIEDEKKDDDEEEQGESIPNVPKDSKSFEERMRESMIQKAQQLKRTRDEEEKDKDSTTTLQTKPVVKKEKKVIGSLSFKSVQKKDGGGVVAPPRVSGRAQGEQALLARLGIFKQKLAEKPTTEDDEWKTHDLKFKVDPSRQDHYM